MRGPLTLCEYQFDSCMGKLPSKFFSTLTQSVLMVHLIQTFSSYLIRVCRLCSTRYCFLARCRMNVYLMPWLMFGVLAKIFKIYLRNNVIYRMIFVWIGGRVFFKLFRIFWKYFEKKLLHFNISICWIEW